MPSLTKSLGTAVVAATAAAAAAVPAQSSPLLSSRQSDSLDPALYSSYDWDPVLNGDENATCADFAVIFARGTFDWPNLGPWVGAPLAGALRSSIPSTSTLAIQGVDPTAYPATLSGYVNEGSPESCGTAIADAIRAYSSACPDTRFAVAGWSQGSLCAHKAFDPAFALTETEVADLGVVSLSVFGDPAGLFADVIPAVPEAVQMFSYCETVTPDPLCVADPLDELITDDPVEFIQALEAMWDQFDSSDLNEAQEEAFGDLVLDLFEQFWAEIDTLATDILEGNLQRWMLTPQHFYYGLDNIESPHYQVAASDIAGAFGV